ncbi:MAG: NADH-quinone oxidoreductase subunit F [Candidatus Zixiibacteriota bacterium]|nr:MAG: NADH-quinone oxidoreductase subunit F [candidate division Zixibacteria bacterium]
MPYRLHVLVCSGQNCVEKESQEVLKAFQAEVEKQNLAEEVQVVATGCHALCGRGPVVLVQPGEIFYVRVKAADVPHIVTEHLLKGRPVARKMYQKPASKDVIPMMSQIPFFSHQRLVVMRNRGLIDPEKIEDYIARDGYQALARALTTLTPEEVIAEITRSGLRGRGGGGFPTGLKWQTCREAPSLDGVRYVICNADEGDPGAFMDRSIVEGDPHAVIEGMCLGAYAVGSSQGYIYVRQEYPLAVKRFQIALQQAREYGLLGRDILSAGFDFDLAVRRGPGAFVCGESTALIASLEGRAGEPRAKYVRTAERGLRDKPTVLNNVETWANVPQIVLNGASWFASLGGGEGAASPSHGSTGTKVFSLGGKVVNTGLVEVPLGIPLRRIITDIGGGIAGGKQFKAVLTGGPTGGFLPESRLDLKVDFETLEQAGSVMGSGGMVVLDDGDCLIDMAKYYVDFLNRESCGKCVPCREGLKSLSQILGRICGGLGREEDIQLLEEMGDFISHASLCGLGKSAAKPVLSTLRYFRDEYTAHIRDLKCPGKTCRSLIVYMIDESKCNGCTICKRACKVDHSIIGELKQPHRIDPELCVKCGSCLAVCKRNAVYKADAVEVFKDFRSRIGAQVA